MSQTVRIKFLWGLSTVAATIIVALAVYSIMSSASAGSYQYNKKIPGEKCNGGSANSNGSDGKECQITEDQCVVSYADECMPDQCSNPTI